MEFWSKPWGKSVSGKQVAGLVALIALAVFAPYAGYAIAQALELGSATVLGLGAAQIITGVIMIGGGLMVGPLIAPKLSCSRRWRSATVLSAAAVGMRTRGDRKGR